MMSQQRHGAYCQLPGSIGAGSSTFREHTTATEMSLHLLRKRKVADPLNTVNRPYACGHCKRAFAYVEHWKSHRKQSPACFHADYLILDQAGQTQPPASQTDHGLQPSWVQRDSHAEVHQQCPEEFPQRSAACRSPDKAEGSTAERPMSAPEACPDLDQPGVVKGSRGAHAPLCQADLDCLQAAAQRQRLGSQPPAAMHQGSQGPASMAT